jgi:hypothetical protein
MIASTDKFSPVLDFSLFSPASRFPDPSLAIAKGTYSQQALSL